MGDIFREIDEELKQERYAKLWQVYGKYFIGTLVAVVVAMAGYRGWDYYQTNKRHAESAQFDAAKSLVEKGKKSDAAALFASMGETSSQGYALLARFHQAALRADQGDETGAISHYNSIAADSSLTGPLRDGAVVLAAMHAIDAPGTDRVSLAANLDALVKDGGPWRHSASELLGLIALQSGDQAKARYHFKRVSDDLDAPPGLRARAAEVLAVLDQ